MPCRFLLLSASMGAGHDAVAGELALRLRERGHAAEVRDVLGLLPAGTGTALRSGYRATLRHAPRLYGGVYAGFLAPGRGPRPGAGPLAALAERGLLRLVAEERPDVVVATFHLAAQVVGRLRGRGALGVPTAVFLVDFAVHRGWLHPGNDLYLCVTRQAADAVHGALGTPAETTGPVVPRGFFGARDPQGHWRERLREAGQGRPAVLLSTGAWGVGGDVRATTGQLTAAGCLPVLLCGRDERLRRQAASEPGLLPLGWVGDLPELMAEVRVLVDNAAGQTAVQALAAGVPVVGHRPLPGHGAEGMRAMTAAGLCARAEGPDEPGATVGRLARSPSARAPYVAAGRALFRGDAVRRLEALAGAAERT